MIGIRQLFLMVSLVAVFTPQPSQAKPEYLKEVPKEGEIPYGKVIYVDDKKCTKGEVKELTGAARKRRFLGRFVA
jgi:hypothetical protein